MNIFKSLSTKVILSLSIVVIPLVILLFFINSYSMDIIRKQAAESNRQLLNFYSNKIEKDLNEIGQYATKISTQNAEVIGFGVYEENSIEYNLAVSTIFKDFTNDVEYYNNIESIFACSSMNGRTVLVTKDNEHSDALRDYINKNYLNSNDIETNRVKTGWRLVNIYGNSMLIYISNTSTNVLMGACININEIMKPLDFLNYKDQSGAALLLNHGDIFTRSKLNEGNLELLKNNSSRLNNNYISCLNAKGDRKYLLDGEKLNILDFKLLHMTPEDILYKKLTFFQKLIYVIPIILLIVIVVHLIIIRSILSKPLNSLIKAMKRIGQGNIDIRVKKSKSNEMNFLIHNFNTMMEQINNLKIDNYERELEVKDLEVKGLQSQINPHFYLNTLNIIYNLAALKEYKYVQDLTLHLADYFRFITQNNQKTIYLKDEINHIKNYLEIHKIRYPKNFKYEIVLPLECENIVIPPLIVQPFVENSIKHGMGRVTPFVIEINITVKGDNLSVISKDNGEGFSEDMIKSLSTEDYFKENTKEHIGIRNVYRRLQLCYEENSKLLFSNGEKGGAIVEILLPISYEKKGDNNV